MNKEELRILADAVHAEGKRLALYACSHVPAELLEAAGFAAVRLPQIEDAPDIAARILPGNLCPLVKECCNTCECAEAAGADLIIAESSCDGKKKMYELLSRRERLYYYQVPQGEDRDYVRPLFRSEMGFFRKMLRERFGIEIGQKSLREAIRLCNAERESMMQLAALQKSVPPAAHGTQLYEVLFASQKIWDREKRIQFIKEETEHLRKAAGLISPSAKRILLTGCPLQGVYRKVIEAVENNGGTVVCLENCDFIKTNIRRTDETTEDLTEALADSYQNTACAIMSPNERRFRLLKSLWREYQVDGVVDVLLQACHSYSVEKDKLRRFCAAEDMPYMAMETSDTETDAGQLETRIAAFIEML